MASQTLIPAGDFRTSYAVDTTIFPTTTSRNAAILSVALICLAPQVLSAYWLSILIQIGIFGIAALGLNVLVGFTGQISIGHAAFFLLGAFTSAYLSNNLPIPVFFCIPLAGAITALIGLIFGLPAARLKGLYLVIATLAAQYILLDFFSRAEWFSGGSVPASANPFSIFGYTFRGDRQYFYVVLAYVVVSYLLVTNLMRTRDGRALVAIRDHYLSAEIMGINLTRYRTLSFGLAAFFAGIAGALDHGHADGHRLRGAAAGIDGMDQPQPEGQRRRQGAAAQQQHHLPARDRNRADHHPVSGVRAGRAGAPLAADQDLLETLPVFALSPERDRLRWTSTKEPEERK
jgi:branched-chain amino acid transport system permease protein